MNFRAFFVHACLLDEAGGVLRGIFLFQELSTMLQPNFSQRRFSQLVLVGLALCLAFGGCGRGSRTPEPQPQALATAVEPDAPIHPPALGLHEERVAVPSRLQLPDIDVDIPVVELGWHPASDGEGQIFAEWDVAEYAAGWHKNSALPGAGGNVVMSGHNNILGAVFRELDQLQRGDGVIVWAGSQRFRYRVEQVIIVPEKHASPQQRAENARWIGPFEDDRLTLVSCWPRDDNTHRIIVVAQPMDESQASRR
jgi:sortase A